MSEYEKLMNEFRKYLLNIGYSKGYVKNIVYYVKKMIKNGVLYYPHELFEAHLMYNVDDAKLRNKLRKYRKLYIEFLNNILNNKYKE